MAGGPGALTIPGTTDLVEIGTGGFATVFRAHQPAMRRDVAVKVLRQALTDEEAARFDREAQILGALSGHPNILTLYASDRTEDGQGYFILEYCPGGSIEDQLVASGPMPWRDAAILLAAVADGVAYAHAQGVLHRDIKPRNILRTSFGTPVLADFGIAHMVDGFATSSGTLTTSLAHGAPEVLEGGSSSEQSDVYSLASTAYALLTGLPPFRKATDESSIAMLTRVLRDPPPDLRPLGVPGDLCELLERSMSKSPGQRPASAAEFRDEIGRIATGRTFVAAAAVAAGATAAAAPDTDDENLTRLEAAIVPPPPSAPPEAGPTADKRRPPLAIAIVAAIVAIVAVVLLFTLDLDSDEPAADGTGAGTSSSTTDTTGSTATTDGAGGSDPVTFATIERVAGSGRPGDEGDGGPALDARFNGANGAVVLADGSIVVADSQNDRVRLIDADGVISTLAGGKNAGFAGDGGPATDALLAFPLDVAELPDGSILIADSGNHRVRVVRPDGTIGTFAGTGVAGFSGDGGQAAQAQLNVPTAVTVAPDGRVLIADSSNRRVRAVAPDGTISTLVGDGRTRPVTEGEPALESTLNRPYGIELAPDGRIIVVDAGNHRIRELAADGTVRTIAGSDESGFAGDGLPGTEGRLNRPFYAVVEPSGRILFTEAENFIVRAIEPDGTLSTIAGTNAAGSTGDGGDPLQATLNHPSGIALSPDGSVIVTDALANTVRRLVPQS